jgi:hypothetical protein
MAFICTLAQAQMPKGYVAGSILLPNNQVLNGYVKESIKKSASISFLDSTGNNKKTFEGNTINGVTIEGITYICLQGDFFKSLSTGKINFMQKASNAAGKISYSGAEPIMSSGTDGKIGDYFTYNNNSLKILNKKNVALFITNDLSNCPPAIEKAKSIQGDITKMAEVINVYNNYSK